MWGLSRVSKVGLVSAAAAAAAAGRLWRQRSLALGTSAWFAQIVKSRYQDIVPSDLNLHDFVWSRIDKHGHRDAVVDGVSGRTLTFREAQRQSANFGIALQKLGAEKYDVVAMFLPNCVEYPLVFFGAPRAGTVITTLNNTYTPHEIAKQLTMSKARWIITVPELIDHIQEALDHVEGADKRDWEGRILLVGDSPSSFHSATKMLETDQDPAGVERVSINVEEDVVVLPYSSGTTGIPKGVMLTHHNIVGNVCQATQGPQEISLLPEASDEKQPITVSVLPMFHVFAMNVTMTPTLYQGGKFVVMPKFEPKTFVTALSKHKPTFLHLAPPLVSFLASNHDVTAADHLSRLEHIVVAAAPSGPALIKAFKEKAPGVVYREGWGMSETSPLVTITPLSDEKNGSCGVLLPNAEAKIIDVSTGADLGPNQRGELLVRGLQNMKGYLDNPSATSETVQAGWLHTGDIAIFDEAGRFYIVDRLKELIKVKGFQVPPAELEDLLRGHCHIQDVAVIGVPHEKFGEAPRAYIVLEPGSDVEKSKGEIVKYVKENAANYKQLVGGIEVMTAIPKSTAGKIQRKDLLAKYKKDFNVA